ncbi:MAG: NINE protein [Clostridia bacterium]|nr:NINE protein [Clostridia bacterium]
MNTRQYKESPKSKTLTLVLSIFLGGFGAHRFYVGKYATGFLWFFTAGIFGFGWIIDVLLIIFNKFRDKHGRLVTSRKQHTNSVLKDSLPAETAVEPFSNSSSKLSEAPKSYSSETTPMPKTKEVPIAGNAIAEKVAATSSNIKLLQKKFIAFDLETTGLNPMSDRIVEIGAVLFIEGNPTKRFSTLVNPNISIPASASAVNNITNTMLQSAPQEEDVYPKLIEFLEEAVNGNIIMCAHNAQFDFNFLCNTLSRLGYDANIQYVDTLSLSRKYIKGLKNYKQCTLENYFNLTNNTAHRASSDAENCGKILCGILKNIDKTFAEEKQQIVQATPGKEELCVCAYIQNIIEENGGDADWIRYRKNSSNYVSITCLYTFLKFKFAKKGRYIIIEKISLDGIDLPIEPCTASEGGTAYCRVYFHSPFDLKPLSKYIFDTFSKCYKSMQEYISMSDYARHEAEESIRLTISISHDEVEALLAYAENHKHDVAPPNIQVKQAISRKDVIINAIHNRVPLSEICNRNDWDKGFSMGYPYWEQGEIARKNDQIGKAITFFDKARYFGYNAPALYDSYAKAYRKIKDYDNEIVILEEGIERMTNIDCAVFEARRDKAIALLFARQEHERKSQEKAQNKELRKNRKKERLHAGPKQQQGRAIIQMTDDGTIIKEFDTIASASREIGVNSKCIRDAANGVQKHAGGYCWKYRD